MIFNYRMDSNDSIFPHQVQAVARLSSIYNKITVITSKSGEYEAMPNVKVISLGWQEKSKLRNIYRLLREFLPLLKEDFVLFSHMTEVQSALVAPITRLLGVKHYLWYAHKSRSLYLRWCHYWVDAIITSTPGSCPITSPKVIAIGQAIDPEVFKFHPPSNFDPLQALHIGRFDPSKNLKLICETCRALGAKGFLIEFTQYGEPSNLSARRAALDLRLEFRPEIDSGQINFRAPVVHSQIPNILREFNLFLHAFDGSLDKTLVEATMAGLPVVTVNVEYLEIFGRWGTGGEFGLQSEIYAITGMSRASLAKELERRRMLAVECHSMENWVSQLVRILSGNLS